MTTATTIEKMMLAIARALRAVDKDTETAPGTWEIPALPMCSVDVDFIRACSPDNIRALLHVARVSHHLAWALAGAANKLGSLDENGVSTLRLIDEADAALKEFRQCFGKPMRKSPPLSEERIWSIWKSDCPPPVQFARRIESECAALWGVPL